MTSQNVRETARETLGKAIRFYRAQRGLTQRDIADRVGVPISDIDHWERGHYPPPSHKWSRLCNMFHSDLANMRAIWQRACAEEEQVKRERKNPAQTLTSKPFANLPEIINKPEPPKLTVVPTPAPAPVQDVPETLLGDEYDLRPAYIEVQKLPAGWQSAEARAARFDYAIDLVHKGMTNEQVVVAMKAKFNVGISPNTLVDVRKRVQDAAKRAAKKQEQPPDPQPTMARGADIHAEVGSRMPPSAAEDINDRVSYVKMLLAKAPSTKIDGVGGLHELLMRKFNKSLSDDHLVQLVNDARASRTTGQAPAVALSVNASDVEAAVRLILDAIPNLRSFTLEVDDAGEVHVNHKVREVKVVESSGSFKIKR